MTKDDSLGLLEFLLRDGVTPSFSFPLDVCEFKVEGLDNDYSKQKVWAKMSHDLRKALIEYAPGREIVVNGVEYTIGGLSFFNPPDKINRARHVFGNRLASDALKWYNRCSNNKCGWVSKDMESKILISNCPVCDGELSSGRWYRPEGFAPIVVPYNSKGDQERPPRKWSGRTKWMKAEKVKKSDSKPPVGRVELPAPLLGDSAEEIQKHDITTIRGLEGFSKRMQVYSSHFDSENVNSGISLILINSGYNSRGYFLCPDCGRLELKNHKRFFQGPHERHHRPYAPLLQRGVEHTETQKREVREMCSGRPLGHDPADDDERGMIMLGMTFKTDLALFRVRKSKEFIQGRKLSRLKQYDHGMRAIKEALIEEIQSTRGFVNREIGAGIRKFNYRDSEGKINYFTDIFLYDEVSGGAGLTLEVVQNLDDLAEVLEKVEFRLSGHRCIDINGCEKACVNCLLDFRNSVEHDRLDRINGLRIIRYLRNGTIPSLESGEREIGDGKRPHAESILQLIQADTELEATIELINGLQVIKITRQDRVLKIRPISEMIKPNHDPLLSSFERNSIKELELEGEAIYDETKIYYLHIDRFSNLRTKISKVIIEMLTPFEEQDL